jgi:hypothetical protein
MHNRDRVKLYARRDKYSRSVFCYGTRFYMSFTFPSPPFLNLRPVANRILSSSAATVRTPPTIAQVLGRVK